MSSACHRDTVRKVRNQLLLRQGYPPVLGRGCEVKAAETKMKRQVKRGWWEMREESRKIGCQKRQRRRTPSATCFAKGAAKGSFCVRCRWGEEEKQIPVGCNVGVVMAVTRAVFSFVRQSFSIAHLPVPRLLKILKVASLKAHHACLRHSAQGSVGSHISRLLPSAQGRFPLGHRLAPLVSRCLRNKDMAAASKE